MAKHCQSKDQISDRIVQLCASDESVSSLLAKDPSLAPGDAWMRLYGDRTARSDAKGAPDANNGTKGIENPGSGSATQGELEKAARCGEWGPTEPSELFLRIYDAALCTLDQDPLRAMVSPALMGSCGTVPLTIISVIPDIVRHMSNVIVRAEREVFLATNYWQNSVASRYITNAIRELDRRAGARGIKIVLKILYDRGSLRQLYEPHYIVSEKEFTNNNVNLPHASELPNIDMQVMNFHTPLVGTFHAKYMVVDRKIALLQSNNIQDNDNLEMLVHLEGPIVDSLYDMALISWHKRLDPPLPSHNSPAALGGLGSWPSAAIAAKPVTTAPEGGNGAVFVPGAVDPSAPTEGSDTTRADVLTGPTTTASVTHSHALRGNLADGGNKPTGTAPEPSPDFHPLPEHTADDPHYDNDIAGEVARIQSALSPKPGETHLQAVTRLLNHTVNRNFPGDPDAPPCPPGEPMTPYVPHQAHTPYPMALVNRAPYGPPTHRSLATPQNAAWLSALRHAQHTVHIVSPTLNASPLIPAIRAACARGVHVHCHVTLGYNDAGELLPRQGGHNEGVAAALHASLPAAPPSPPSSPGGPAAEEESVRERLHWRWYVAKDQTRPITQARRQRSSHVKLMIVDGRVGIVGNGNQDTQSWFHSAEINLMVDSPELCAEWLRALGRNQNTERFGAVDARDGVWRDGEGKEVDGAMGPDAGKFAWLKGVKGAVDRVRGKGGF